MKELFEMPPVRAPKICENTVFHIGVSGGKDSTAVLLWMVHESGIDRSKLDVTFCDTGNEHKLTYEHVQMLSERVHPISTLTPERDFYELALWKHRFPSSQVRFCTEFLKIVPTRDRLTWLMWRGLSPIAVSGIRGDESDERGKLEEWGFNGMLICHQWLPLISWTIEDVFAIHRKYGVPLNPLYAEGAERVGCFPCIMSKKREIRTIAINHPDRIAQIRGKEVQFEKQHGRFSSFFSADKVPLRFRSKECVISDGTAVMIPTIDDVVRWSFTGKNAKGSYKDETEEVRGCMSGYCE